MSEMVFTPDGDTLVTMGDYVVNLWDVKNCSILRVYAVEYPRDRLHDVAVDEAGQVLAYLIESRGRANRKVVFVSLDSGQRINVWNGSVASAAPDADRGDGVWRLPSDIPGTPTSIDIVGGGVRSLNSVLVGFSSGVVLHLYKSESDAQVARIESGVEGLSVIGVHGNDVMWAGRTGARLANLDEVRSAAPVRGDLPGVGINVANRFAYLGGEAHELSAHNEPSIVFFNASVDGPRPVLMKYEVSDTGGFYGFHGGTQFVGKRTGLVDVHMDDVGQVFAYRNGDVEIVGRGAFRSENGEAGDLTVTALAGSRSALAIAHGEIVSLYQRP